jgi:hypothetical protein
MILVMVCLNSSGCFIKYSNSADLHVTVLDSVVDHLDEVPGASFSDPVAAGLPVVHLGTDRLEDWGNVWPETNVI